MIHKFSIVTYPQYILPAPQNYLPTAVTLPGLKTAILGVSIKIKQTAHGLTALIDDDICVALMRDVKIIGTNAEIRLSKFTRNNTTAKIYQYEALQKPSNLVDFYESRRMRVPIQCALLLHNIQKSRTNIALRR